MSDVAKILRNGGVGVLATDTLYGLVGSALNQKAVERIYALKGRQSTKPLIILIGQVEDLALFDIEISPGLIQTLSKYWPGPVSIVLPCESSRFKYLHRGGKSLAFRLPGKKSFREFLKSSGPLVAPSANPENQSPARTIAEARDYFGDEVDFYKPGRTQSSPSKIIAITKGKVRVIRP